MRLKLYNITFDMETARVVSTDPGEALNYVANTREMDMREGVRIEEVPNDTWICTGNGDRKVEALIALAGGKHPVEVDAYMNEVCE